MRAPVGRTVFVWLLLMATETVHGVARTVWLSPAVGDFRARQIAVFTGSVLIVLIACLTIRWFPVRNRRTLFSIGTLWVVLTLLFEIGLGRFVLGLSWQRLASDYNILEGGVLPIGLLVMASSPWLAARIRGLAENEGHTHEP
jgi:hypothetical protein